MGFAASGGHATRQLAAVRGVGPRRVSSWRRRRRRDPRGLAPPRGTGVRRGSRQTQRPASEPAGPTVAADDAPTSCLGDNGTASLPWALSTATGSAQVRRPASRPSCPSFPASSQPQRPTLRCRQICAGTTSSCSNFPDGSVHFRPFPLEKISPAPGNRILTALVLAVLARPHPVAFARIIPAQGADPLHARLQLAKLPCLGIPADISDVPNVESNRLSPTVPVFMATRNSLSSRHSLGFKNAGANDHRPSPKATIERVRIVVPYARRAHLPVFALSWASAMGAALFRRLLSRSFIRVYVRGHSIFSAF